jgi:hypothetical protein
VGQGASWRSRGLDFWALLVVAANAALFVVPGWRAAGVWPLPLDDSYIYFAHARAIAEGSPGAWIAGQGYSSGATAIGYPYLLAPFWLIGLRGSDLGLAACGLAFLFVVDLARSLAKLHPHWLVAPLVVGVPLSAWSLWSGMEVALVGALMGRALVAVHESASHDVGRRRQRQRAAGLWLAALVVTRPETLPLALGLSVAGVWAARSLSTWGSLARLVGSPIVALAAQAAVQRVFTGEWLAAGAIRKGLWALGPAEAAVGWLQNLVVLSSQAFVRALGGVPGALLFAGLATVALARRRTRRLALPLAFGILGGLALICANATARFQNYRYAAPLLSMIVALAVLGLAGLGPRLRLVLGLVALAAPLGQLARERTHFARASANVAEQHLEVARRVMALPPGAIFVNDAGAIPYLTGRPAIDGLGLGGAHALPFARASVVGVPAVIELIERLPPAKRPAWLVVYPSWWPGLVDVFGQRVDSVQIEHNVICAADEKVIYAADWSLLDREAGGLDVGDLVDERHHDHDGSGILVARHERELWDAGRSYAAGESEWFSLPRGGPLVLESRTDAPAVIEVRLWRLGEIVRREPHRITAQGFSWSTVDLGEVCPGDRLEVRVVEGPWRSFHHRFVAGP